MDLTEAKRLIQQKHICASDRVDIRNAIQRNLANQVPGLVAEVERLRGELADAAKNERNEIILYLEGKLQGMQHPDDRRPVAAVIDGLRNRKS